VVYSHMPSFVSHSSTRPIRFAVQWITSSKTGVRRVAADDCMSMCFAVPWSCETNSSATVKRLTAGMPATL
jgi:hypothetical protein